VGVKGHRVGLIGNPRTTSASCRCQPASRCVTGRASRRRRQRVPAAGGGNSRARHRAGTTTSGGGAHMHLVAGWRRATRAGIPFRAGPDAGGARPHRCRRRFTTCSCHTRATAPSDRTAAAACRTRCRGGGLLNVARWSGVQALAAWTNSHAAAGVRRIARRSSPRPRGPQDYVAPPVAMP